MASKLTSHMKKGAQVGARAPLPALNAAAPAGLPIPPAIHMPLHMWRLCVHIHTYAHRQAGCCLLVGCIPVAQSCPAGQWQWSVAVWRWQWQWSLTVELCGRFSCTLSTPAPGVLTSLAVMCCGCCAHAAAGFLHVWTGAAAAAQLLPAKQACRGCAWAQPIVLHADR